MTDNDRAQRDIDTTYTKALQKYPNSFNSAHEGYAILLEEVDELWEEVKRQDRDIVKLATEASHVGAMAKRFLADVVYGGK